MENIQCVSLDSPSLRYICWTIYKSYMKLTYVMQHLILNTLYFITFFKISLCFRVITNFCLCRTRYSFGKSAVGLGTVLIVGLDQVPVFGQTTGRPSFSKNVISAQLPEILKTVTWWCYHNSCGCQCGEECLGREDSGSRCIGRGGQRSIPSWKKKKARLLCMRSVTFIDFYLVFGSI